MAEQAYAYVTLIPVAKGFQRAVAKELDGVGGVGGKAGDVTGKNFSEGFGGQLKKLGLLAAGALATAGVGRLLGDSVKQASDLGESLNAVNVVFEESAAGIAKIGESASKNLGLSQTEFNAAAVQFSSFAEKIAGDGGDVVGTIEQLTTRGADFASVMNLEVSEALQVFQSGLAGETEPLKKFGIDLSAASVEAYALEAGIIAAGESMTESQKVQARYGALLEQTAKTSGDFANTSDSLANQQRILQAEFANVQASIGVALIPVLEKLQGIVIDKVLPAFEGFGDWLESPAGIAAVEGLTNVITGLVEFTIDLVGAIGTALPILAALGTAFIVMQGKVILAHTAIGVATVAQLALNAAMAANPIGLVITALAALAIGIGAFINANKEATPTQEELNGKIAQATKELEFYRAEQDKSTNSSKLYESTINDLEAELREYRAALQESYNFTEAQKDASYRARDAAIAQRNATKDLKGEVDRYADSVRLASGALISHAVLQEAQYNFLQDYNYSLGTTTKTLQDWIDELTQRNLAEMQGISTSEFYATATDEVASSTSSATTAIQGQTTAVENLAGTYESAAGAIDQATASLDRFAGATPGDPGPGGLFPVQGPGGEYLASLDDSVSGQLRVIEANLAREFGAQTASEILERSLGGTAREIENTFRRGTEFVNTEANRRVIGNIQGAQAEKLIAEGFVEVGKVSASNEDLANAINDLARDISSGNIENYTPFAKGGLVTGPTRALIGEAGPEVVIPLNRFESMMGMGEGKTLVYNAAPNGSMDAEAELFTAMRRAKVVANW